MKVALDAQLAVGTATGIGEYVHGLAAALRDLGVDVATLAEATLSPWRFDRRLLWDQVLLPRRAARSGADLLHCASGTMPLFLPLPTVVTVHDVAWLRVQNHARFYARTYFGAFSLARYRHARRIVVDSTFSRTELCEFGGIDPACVDVVYPGVAPEYARLQRRSDGTTILAVGTVERRKNLAVLIRALPAVPYARLVSVGPRTPYAQECLALAGRLGVAQRVELRGYVSRAELIALHAECAVAAVPSRYEGFGYAAAQALCAGVPLVVSDAGSLPEVVGDGAPLIAPDDGQAWAAALREALGSSQAQLRAEALRAGAVTRFAWPAMAQAMTGVYQRALAT